MTEFEIATLAYHERTLSLREAALWVAIAHVLVGAGKLAAICWGIRVMHGISDDWRRDIEARNRRTEARNRRTEEYARQARKRHEEAMRQSRKRHEEAMRQGRERHEEAMAALTELIRRTDAPGTA
ncbi:MAG: hypothetical protein OXQ29_00340 [Rhodospirillaceae bacterium]|nr:hypothetical protein [Rhodospirillaceae bacterium]